MEGNVSKSLVPLFKQPSATPSICIPLQTTDSQDGALQINTTQVNFSPTKIGELSGMKVHFIIKFITRT